MTTSISELSVAAVWFDACKNNVRNLVKLLEFGPVMALIHLEADQKDCLLLVHEVLTSQARSSQRLN